MVTLRVLGTSVAASGEARKNVAFGRFSTTLVVGMLLAATLLLPTTTTALAAPALAPCLSATGFSDSSAYSLIPDRLFAQQAALIVDNSRRYSLIPDRWFALQALAILSGDRSEFSQIPDRVLAQQTVGCVALAGSVARVMQGGAR